MQEAKIVDIDFPYDYDDLTLRRRTDMIVIHHTGNEYDSDWGVEKINEAHQNQDFVCIGYHYVVRKDGTIERGRPHWTVGAHSYGDNDHTIGIHLSGNFNLVEPTEEQIENLALLINTVCHTYGLPIDEEHIVGHRDLSDTACPGDNLYDMLPTIIGKAIFYRNN